jgi:hypothetical protein
MSRPLVRWTLPVLLGFLGQARAIAWHETGHKLVAAIAYAELAARERTAIDVILKRHTNFQSWKAEFEHARPSLSLGQFIFMQASVWPDQIRDSHKPETHPEWHYIDYPLRPPGFPDEAAPNRPNVLSAIDQVSNVLTKHGASRQVQAESLAWLIHLVGDVHQPLHCSSLFGGPFKGREGDRGGNNFWVKLHEESARPVKLHTLWDGLPGSGKDPDRLAKKASEWMAAHPRNQFPAAAFAATPLAWSRESRQLSLDHAYLPLPTLDGRQAQPVVAPLDYFEKSKALAETQVTLAGYRLADQIRAILSGDR